MTFSIVARDQDTGDLGIAVASKFPAVGALVPWIHLNAGAIATQAHANLSYGDMGLNLLSAGANAEQVARILLENDEEREHRQVGIVDRAGNSFSFTGSECYPWAGGIYERNYAIQGNILVGEKVINSMEQAFLNAQGDFPEKLLSALEAGNSEGGDKRGEQSATLIVLKENGGYGGRSNRYIDVRVDDHPQAVKELRRIFENYSITLLQREDENDVIQLDDKLYKKIGEKLHNLGLLEGSYSIEHIKAAFIQWMHNENFENKVRSDGKIWNSIIKYLFEKEF